MRSKNRVRLATVLAGATVTSLAMADQVINDDLIVLMSECVGTDCVNGEDFGFDTFRLKENNLRIHFLDTSNSSSFPSNDWRLTANDSANGGLNRFSIDDATAGNSPLTIEAGAGANALYVDDGGRVGVGTSSPAVEVHVADGDSPALRLEQDGSSGFTPQTWDIAGNEANFFVRDVTNGSRLPFKIKPSAPTGSLFIAADGDIGLGTESPATKLDVNGGAIVRGDANVIGTVNPGATSGTVLVQAARTDFGPHMILQNTDASSTFVGFRMAAGTTNIDFNNTAAQWRINFDDGDSQEFSLDAGGNIVITGSLTANGSTFPDYVFEADYELMPLDEVDAYIKAHGHLPKVPSAEETKEKGLNMTETQKLLMEKVEELTLHTIRQQQLIDDLRARLDHLEK